MAVFFYSTEWAQLGFSHQVNVLIFKGKKWIVFVFWAIIRF